MKRNRRCRRLITVLVTIPILLGLAQGQQSKGTQDSQRGVTTKRNSQRSIEIEDLINQTHAVPAEFAIDALLRLALSGRITDSRWKREILEEAFILTSQVQNPLRRRVIALPGSSVDTSSGYRSYAFDLGLDELTLRSRIVTAMLPLDKLRARQMVNDVPPKLPIKPLTCSDSLTYEVGVFYEMLGKVAQTAFDETQIQQGERLQFLLPYVESMSSPSQVGSIANLIVSLKLKLTEFLPLSQAYASALKNISADDRSFSDALTRGRTVNSMYRLLQSYREEKAPYKDVLDAFRAYLLKHLTQGRCFDNIKDTRNELPTYLKEANFLFPDRPLTLDDVQPSRIEPTGKVISYYETDESARLLTGFKSLLTDDNDEPISEEVRAATEWQQRMLDYLRQLESWDGHAENSDIDYFHQKSAFYFSLLKIAPSGTPRDQVMTSYIRAMNQGGIQEKSRVEWLLHAEELIQVVRATSGTERSKLLDRLIYSNNPALRLYATLVKTDLL